MSDEPSKPTVVEFKKGNFPDMVTMLRTIADNIEKGEYPYIDKDGFGAVVLSRGERWPTVFGVGRDAFPANMVYVLSMGLSFMVNQHATRA